MLELFSQTMAITAPVFAMLFLGVLLRRLGLIDVPFIDTASALVFNATMPTLLFLGIVEADVGDALPVATLVYYAVGTLVCFALCWCWAVRFCPYEERGVCTQGAFRGNNGVVGLALVTSLYGDYGLTLGSLLAGMVIIFYNALSAVVLAVYSPAVKSDPLSVARSIAKNPMIIGVLAALPFAIWRIPLPEWLLTSGHYFAQMTLPLALICIGGTLSIASLQRGRGLALSTSLMKMVWLPAVLTLGAWLLGFRGADLGVLFLYFASPTAAASYVMARAVGGNHELAATIIVVSTLMAVPVSNIGLFVLQWGGWI